MRFFACPILVDLQADRRSFFFHFSNFFPSLAGLLTRYRRAARANLRHKNLGKKNKKYAKSEKFAKK